MVPTQVCYYAKCYSQYLPPPQKENRRNLSTLGLTKDHLKQAPQIDWNK